VFLPERVYSSCEVSAGARWPHLREALGGGICPLQHGDRDLLCRTLDCHGSVQTTGIDGSDSAFQDIAEDIRIRQSRFVQTYIIAECTAVERTEGIAMDPRLIYQEKQKHA
jgi:hypothetical protein